MDNLIKMPVTVFIDAVDVCQYLCKDEYQAGYSFSGCHKESKKQQLKQGKSMFIWRTQRRCKQFRTDAVV